MPTKDPRVDAYIAKAADFTKPILTHIRRLVHAACPDMVETMKWSFPHFDCKGIMRSMAAFKQHCSFGFWKSELILGSTAAEDEAMGHFGRITSLVDLPKDKVLFGYIRKAAELNEAGIKKPARNGWRRPSNGWPKANQGTGSTSGVERRGTAAARDC